jgi:hypothetical protein
MAILIIIFVLFLMFSGSSKPAKGGFGNAIVGTGRSPMYYDIMDEATAEQEAELRQAVVDGKTFTRTSFNWEDRNDKTKHVTTTMTAQERLDEFLKWKANGYM